MVWGLDALRMISSTFVIQYLIKGAADMQKISPFLWFDGNAEEAMNFYTSIFSDSRIESINRSGPEGKVISGTFLLNGMRYMALNGGPHFKFTLPFRCSSTASRRKKSTPCGRSCLKVASLSAAVGYKINSAYPGRLSRPLWGNCSTPRIA